MTNIGNVTITNDNTGALNKMRDDFVARVAEHNNVALMATDKAWASENTATGKTIQTILGDDYGDATIQEQGNALWDANAKGLKALLEAQGVNYSDLEPEVVATLDALANIHGPSGVMKKLSNSDDAKAMLDKLKDWNDGNLFNNIDHIDGRQNNLLDKIGDALTGIVGGGPEAMGDDNTSRQAGAGESTAGTGSNTNANPTGENEDFSANALGNNETSTATDTTGAVTNVDDAAPVEGTGPSVDEQMDAVKIMIANGHAQRQAAMAGLPTLLPAAGSPQMEALARELGNDIMQRFGALDTAKNYAGEATEALTALQAQIQAMPEGDDKARLQDKFNALSLDLSELNTDSDNSEVALQAIVGQIQDLTLTDPTPWENGSFFRTYKNEVSGLEKADKRQNDDDPSEEFYGKYRLPESFIRNTYGAVIADTFELPSVNDIEDKHIHAFVRNPKRFGLEDKDAPVVAYMELARNSLIRTLGEAGYTQLELSADRPEVMAAFEIAMAKQAGYLADNENVALTQEQKNNVVTFFENELKHQGIEMINIQPFMPAEVITNDGATAAT